MNEKQTGRKVKKRTMKEKREEWSEPGWLRPEDVDDYLREIKGEN